jgi:hypothetical protein
MLAPSPASILNHNSPDLGIPPDSKINKSALRPVEIQDSTFGLVVIQAADGTIRTD